MGKSRLLIVEDDVDIGNMLKIYFGGMDFDVDVAVRGSEALEKTRQVLPNLIVLDMILTVMRCAVTFVRTCEQAISP
jgi:DNA-binding response OmpR family regulator